jgi:hypothetical protein
LLSVILMITVPAHSNQRVKDEGPLAVGRT